MKCPEINLSAYKGDIPTSHTNMYHSPKEVAAAAVVVFLSLLYKHRFGILSR
jgi:hypothetical protein